MSKKTEQKLIKKGLKDSYKNKEKNTIVSLNSTINERLNVVKLWTNLGLTKEQALIAMSQKFTKTPEGINKGDDYSFNNFDAEDKVNVFIGYAMAS
jgi:hypothetical protein